MSSSRRCCCCTRNRRAPGVPAAVAVALRIEATSAQAALAALLEQQLLEVPPADPPQGYRYAAAGSRLTQSVDRLARLYAEQRLEVIKQMSANAIERLRSSAARAFADAFIFKGWKGDDR